MADVYSAIILDDDWWDGTESWGGETSESNRDTKFSTRRYTSASAWEAARDGEGQAGDNEIGEVIGPWSSVDSTYFLILGWSAYPILKCPPTLNDAQDNPAFHAGEWKKTNAYILEMSRDSYINYFFVDGEFDGVQLNNTHATGNAIRMGAAEVTLKNCFLGVSGGANGILTQNAASILHFINSALFTTSTQTGTTSGIWFDDCDEANVDHSIIKGFYNGLERDTGTIVVRNSAVFDNTDDFNGTFDTINYCASDDGDGTNAVAPSGSDWDNEYTDPDNYDFFPLNSGNVFEGGVTVSGQTTDMVGASWASSPSIGILEYVSSGTTYNETVNETMDMSDGLTGTLTISATIAESMGFGDGLSPIFSFSDLIGETINLSDAVTSTAVLNMTIAESFILTDGVTDGTIYNETVNESFTLTDAASLANTISAIVAENINLSDTASGVITLNLTIDETLSLSEQLVLTAIYNDIINEQLILTDTVSAGDVLDGQMCVTITGKSGAITIGSKKAEITISYKSGSIDISGSCCT